MLRCPLVRPFSRDRGCFWKAGGGGGRRMAGTGGRHARLLDPSCQHGKRAASPQTGLDSEGHPFELRGGGGGLPSGSKKKRVERGWGDDDDTKAAPVGEEVKSSLGGRTLRWAETPAP